MTGIARGTAESKMARLLGNAKLPTAMAHVITDLNLVTEKSFVNVDSELTSHMSCHPI